MTRQEQAALKVNESLDKKFRLREYKVDILKQKDRLNHYYMNAPEGCADPKLVGREMRRLEKEYNKADREIDRLDKEIFRLRRKYNLSLQ